ncbi:MAG: HD domain-containing phosphohydrolase, partial [Spirochaetia bacterium]
DTIQKGAFDYITKPFSLHVVLSCIDRALERRRLILENRAYQQNLENLVDERTRELQDTLGRIETIYDETIKALGVALDLRDSETEHHCLRVSSFVLKLARKMGLTEEDRLRDIEWGAFLHDIGKIGVPDSILMKPGKLTEEERKIIQTHPVLGYQMLRKIPFLKGAAAVVYSHHESYDGSGYPQGLQGGDIPVSARLFAVADTIDAMTSDRPYRNALPIEEVGRELKKLTGKQFDPKIVDVYFSIPSTEWSI